MSQIGNQAFMQRFVMFLNTASLPLAEELIAPEAVFRAPVSGHEYTGPEGYVAILQRLRSGFPDAVWHLEEVVGEGNVLVARFSVVGTHQGEFEGYAPSHRAVKVSAMNLYRLKNGRIVREFAQFDHLSLLWQIGVYPPPSQAV
ncbi:ester cyclase [Neisseria leonii]|uniref:ester cyclase n=1 Tax=Neisseria leonii TaxID=2995413 RepID=UPI00237BD0A5|nr:ester cyclase [Neisseria sp. 3986]MDD9325176.1 ester cyclase [Neisseria sp. 3986]